MNNSPNRIDPTPLRMSTNMSVERQTPKADFGDRLKAGLSATASAVAGGAAVVSPLVPGAGIVSAAVSSVGGVASTNTGVQSGSTVNARYLSTGGGMGALSLGGGMGGVNTTVQTAGGNTVGSTGTSGIGTGSTTSSVDGISVQQANVGGSGEDMVNQMAQESQQLLQLQFQMQQETQEFQAISNVLKTRNDTAKNSIGNIH